MTGAAAGRSAAARLAAVRRSPVTPAAVALAAFAAVGVALLDDYGVSWDEVGQRLIGQTVVNSVLPGAADLPADRIMASPDYGGVFAPYEWYYGVAFEAPLILIERLLRLADTRAVFLTRHLLTHLFFLAGGLFCYLLVYRLFGDRYLALFALLLFLLHPRIYAHSFFNSKDLPFLAAFMIALYLLERACRRGTAAAGALCGVGVGVLVNLRVMGIMLFAAALGLRALDLLTARGAAERRRVLAATAAFVLAAYGTLYALSPYLWRDPFAIADAIMALARHPAGSGSLFRGETVRWPSIPPHFIPTWMAITTPPATLILCLTGVAAVAGRTAARRRAFLRRALRHTPVRFGWLLIVCLALPPAAVAALNSNVYGDWRQMYFLYAPACLLAVYGLRALLAGARRTDLRRANWLRRGIYALAAAALAGAAVDVARLHPHGQAYFNFLVDRRTPERLRTQFGMMYWGYQVREGLQHLLARYPGATLRVDTFNPGLVWHHRLILPAEERRRIVIADDAGDNPDFFIRRSPPDDPALPVVYARRIYHNTVLAVTAVDLSRIDRPAAAYRAAYRAAVAGEPLVRSEFDVYRDGRMLTWVNESCHPEDTAHPFLLRIVPAAVEDLPRQHRERGWQSLDFRFGPYGMRFDGRCLVRRRLPDYPIRALEVGRRLPGGLALLYAIIDLPSAAPPAPSPASRYWRAHAAITAGDRGPPDVRAAPAGGAAFDLYLDAAGGELTYHKEPCAAEDLQARFYLLLFPADPAELAAHERPHGYHNYGFHFADHGALLRGGACVALVPLPAYEHGVARIRTGQFIIGQETGLWMAEFPGDAAGE